MVTGSPERPWTRKSFPFGECRNSRRGEALAGPAARSTRCDMKKKSCPLPCWMCPESKIGLSNVVAGSHEPMIWRGRFRRLLSKEFAFHLHDVRRSNPRHGKLENRSWLRSEPARPSFGRTPGPGWSWIPELADRVDIDPVRESLVHTGVGHRLPINGEVISVRALAIERGLLHARISGSTGARFRRLVEIASRSAQCRSSAGPERYRRARPTSVWSCTDSASTVTVSDVVPTSRTISGRPSSVCSRTT